MKKETILIIALAGLTTLAASTFFVGMAAHGVISKPESSESSVVSEISSEESYNENADYVIDKGSYSYHLVKTADELKIELEADSYIGTVTVTIAHEQEELDFSYNAEGEELSISRPDEKYGYKTEVEYTVTNSKTVTLQAALTGKAHVTKEVAVTLK